MKSPVGYNSDRFSFAAIFEQLTAYMQNHAISPVEAYLLYQQHRRKAHLTPCPDYASTSITSGGHARRAGLVMEQIIAANTRTARDLIVLMDQQGSLDRQSVILSVDLGHVLGWNQSDYMHFWLLVIGGFDLWVRPGNDRVKRYEQALKQALKDCQVNLKAMNSFNLSAKERAVHYFRFADACVQAAAESKADRQAAPVRKIISLIDPQVSLGGQTERYFARRMGIPVYLPCAVKPADAWGEVVTARQLVRDVEMIISFGGTVFEVADHVALVCLRDDTQKEVDLAALGGGLHHMLAKHRRT